VPSATLRRRATCHTCHSDCNWWSPVVVLIVDLIVLLIANLVAAAPVHSCTAALLHRLLATNEARLQASLRVVGAITFSKAARARATPPLVHRWCSRACHCPRPLPSFIPP
jgi:hypothetical protein